MKLGVENASLPASERGDVPVKSVDMSVPSIANASKGRVVQESEGKYR